MDVVVALAASCPNCDEDDAALAVAFDAVFANADGVLGSTSSWVLDDVCCPCPNLLGSPANVATKYP